MLITSNFVIHKQILIFSVYKIESLSFFTDNKVFSVASAEAATSMHPVTQGSYAFVCLNISNILLTHK